MKKEKFTLYAFWNYDFFPFLLGAPINTEDMRDDGRVAPPSYGGYLFRPVKVTTFEHGKKIEKELNALKAEKDKAMMEIDTRFKQLLNTLKNTAGLPK